MHPVRKLNRLKGYDYSRNALYFVTSCVQDRKCCLGEIKNQEMILNGYGEIVERQWLWLKEQYNYVVSHSFVVMPNHIHGIIEIDGTIAGTGRDLCDIEHDGHTVGTGRDLSLPDEQTPQKIKSLSDIMGAFKTTSSKQIHLAGLPDFKWQRSFHDHIIRDEKAYLNISNYIENNPSKWADDKFYF